MSTAKSVLTAHLFDTSGSFVGVLGPNGDEQKLFTPAQAANSGLALFVPPVVDVTRNSANDSTDSTEQTLATLVVPPNVLRIGSIAELWAVFENTNSASSKTYIVKLNDSQVGSSANTTNQSFGIRWPFHVHDENTIGYLNAITSAGSSGQAAASPGLAVPSVVSSGFTFKLNVKWGGAASSEFIRLKFAKLNLII